MENQEIFSGDDYSFETDELRDVSPQRSVTHTEEGVTQRKGLHTKGVRALNMKTEGTHALLSYVGQARDQHIIPLQKLNW